MRNLSVESNDDDEVEPAVGAGVWSGNIESYFISLIEDEVKKGNKRNTSLTKPAWKFIKHKLREETKKDYSQEQLKNKYNQLRYRWRDFSKLLMEIGIGYNAVTFQVSAEEDVWKKLYEKYKFAKAFKKKGCKHYNKLCKIFGDTTTGANPHSCTNSPSDSEDEDDTKEENGDSDKQYDEGSQSKKAKSVANPKKLGERVNTANTLVATPMSENSKEKLELLERRMSATTSSTLPNNSNGGEHDLVEDHDLLMKCIDELSSLEGIDGASFAKATKMFHDDLLWRKIFLQLSRDRKKDLILNI